MEKAAKRKRPAEKGDAEGRRKKGESSVVAVVAAPTEEEVEEFFAILRMHAAVKYFQKSKSNRQAHDPVTAENWAMSSEAKPFEGIDGGNDAELKIVEESRVLDLNVIPPEDETESNSYSA